MSADLHFLNRAISVAVGAAWDKHTQMRTANPGDIARAVVKALDGEGLFASNEMLAALNDLEWAVRVADIDFAVKVGFVWGQRGDDILAGRESWADQKMGEPTPGGSREGQDP